MLVLLVSCPGSPAPNGGAAGVPPPGFLEAHLSSADEAEVLVIDSTDSLRRFEENVTHSASPTLSDIRSEAP